MISRIDNLCATLAGAFAVLSSAAASPVQDDRDLRRHDVSAGSLEAADSGWAARLVEFVQRAQTAAAQRGVEANVFFTLDASQHVSGGAAPGSGAVRELFDLVLAVDGAKLGVPGGRLLFDVQGIAGEDASAEVGVVQAYSSIDAPDDRLQLARVWWEQTWDGPLSALRVGKMDANGWFAYTDGGSRFLHSSQGFSPTILSLPTYPDSAFGAAALLQGAWQSELRLGIYDGSFQEGRRTGLYGPSSVFGAPSDLFLIAEADLGWGVRGEDGGRIGLGAWRHTGDFARYGGGVEQHATGTYAVLEHDVRPASDAPLLQFFAQFGSADEELSPIESYWSLGAVALQPFSARFDDALGIAFSSAELSEQAGFTRDAETVVELFYALDVIPGVRLKPDVQYIGSPGGAAGISDAWIVTLRVTLAL